MMNKTESLEELLLLLLHYVWRDFCSLIASFNAFIIKANNENGQLRIDLECQCESKCGGVDTEVPPGYINHILTFMLWLFLSAIRFGLQPMVYTSHVVHVVEFSARTNCSNKKYSPTKCDSLMDHAQFKVCLDRETTTHSVIVLVVLAALLVYHLQHSSAAHDCTLIEMQKSIFSYSAMNALKRDRHSDIPWHHLLQLNKTLHGNDCQPYPNNTRGHGCDLLNSDCSSVCQMYSSRALLSNCTAADSMMQYSTAEDAPSSAYYWTVASTILVLGMSQLVFAKPLPLGQLSSLKTDTQKTRRDSSNFFRSVRESARSLVVSLQGNPNTGYCTDVAIGITNTQEVKFNYFCGSRAYFLNLLHIVASHIDTTNHDCSQNISLVVAVLYDCVMCPST